MKVRLLKDWSFHKKGDTVEVFEPTGLNWLLNGIAEEPVEARSLDVEEAVSRQPEAAERAMQGRRRKP
jgi:hypothetical protein